jgi:hypothetical protein
LKLSFATTDGKSDRYDRVNPAQPNRRSFAPYLIGAFLCYACCFILFGRAFVAGTCWRFEIAAFGAFFMWLPLCPLHAVFQLLLSFLVARYWEAGRKHKVLVLNVPVLALTVLLLLFAEASRRTEPNLAFKYFVADPIPKSVRLLEFSRFQAIGEPMALGLKFQVQPADMDVVLHNKNCALASIPTNSVELELFRLRLSSGFDTGIKVDPDIIRFHFVINEDKRWHLLLNSNRSTAFFYYARSPSFL